MSCFIVPMVQAIATSAYRKHNEKDNSNASIWKKELPTLEKMLWGATIVLIIDHIACGELSWQFPFFTALGKLGGLERMLDEILSVGVPMSLALTAIWAVSVLIRRPALKSQSR